MIVMFLVIVWLAVLGPMAVRYFREGGSRDSVESFHEQMHLLERAGPKLVAPAHTLDGAVPEGSDPEEPWSGGVRSGGDGGREMGSHAGLFLLEATGTSPGLAGTSPWVATRVRTHRRRRGQRRRRDLVLVAMAVAVLSCGLGALPGLHLVWVVTVVAMLLIGGCAALGAYAQVLDADRRASAPAPGVHAAVPPPSPWSIGPVTEARRNRSGQVARRQWAARAGFPGAWDDDAEDDYGAKKVAVGG